MQINWFTVIAQIINFLILVWLMKKYLYKPILLAIDEREKKIAAELAEAKRAMAEANNERVEFEKKNDAFDQNKKKMMDQVTADAVTERQKLLEGAKNEAADLKHKLEDAAKKLQESLNDQLSQKTQEDVLLITKKALMELASTTLEEQSVNVFIRNIKAIKDKDKKQFIDAFQTHSNPLSIKSAFDLSEKLKNNIETAIAGLLGAKVKYAFETDPTMVGGIELVTEGYKLSWSFAAYVNSLEKSIAANTKKSVKVVKK